MKLPKSINVMGQRYKVLIVKNMAQDFGRLGLCDFTKKVISIDSALKGNDLIHTYIHEVIHAQSCEVGLYQAISTELLEIIAETTATNMIRLFKITNK